jgi:hypothetical protein
MREIENAMGASTKIVKIATIGTMLFAIRLKF